MHMVLDHAEKLAAYSSENQKLIMNALLKVIAMYFPLFNKTIK